MKSRLAKNKVGLPWDKINGKEKEKEKKTGFGYNCLGGKVVGGGGPKKVASHLGGGEGERLGPWTE